jgi:hypothetical protein
MLNSGLKCLERGRGGSRESAAFLLLSEEFFIARLLQRLENFCSLDTFPCLASVGHINVKINLM